MKLRFRFLIIILSATCISIAGVIYGLSSELQNYWEQETKQKIVSGKLGYLSSINQLTDTATSSAILIGEDDLIAQYYALSESSRDSELATAVEKYLKTILSLYSYMVEISLITENGVEEVRVSRGNGHAKQNNVSPLVAAAWQTPGKSLIDFEYNEEFKRHTLNVYRAISFDDPSQPSHLDKVTTVVRIAISTVYLEDLAWQHLITKNSFIMIHNGNGEVILHSGAELPKNLAQIPHNTFTSESDELKAMGVILDNDTVYEDWHLVFMLPMDEALSSIKKITIKGGITLLVFFAILGASIFTMLSLLIIKPLGELADATKRFADGHEFPEIKPRDDEIGDLQKAFSQMSEKMNTQTLSLRKQAYTDKLTGLPNRNLLGSLVNNALRDSRDNDLKVALMFMDLDGFKQVNDVLGHNAGDALLQKVAERLGGILRVGDSVARYNNEEDIKKKSLIRLGGDEFTVVLPGLRQREDASTVAKRLIEQFNMPFRILGKEVFVGASIGVAFYPDDARNIDELVKYADTAMYAAKKAGKMRAMFFDQEMFSKSKARLELENILHHAFSANEFKVAYQPKVDPSSHKVVGFEALARLETKKMGVISPAEFIPIAEKTGLIDNLTLLLIEQICQQIVTMEGSIGRAFSVAINISPGQLVNHELFENILKIVEKYEVDPGLIEFEVTENSLIDNEVLAEKELLRLHTLGFRTALDDFGVGYSSLGHLKRFKFDTLKIDRMFFVDVEANPNAKAILVSIIDLARKLGMEIVAEGIETQEQMNFVAENGIDLVQGYFYAKPEFADKLPELISHIECHKKTA